MPPSQAEITAGTVVSGFEAILPVADDVCRRNIADSIGRDFIEAKPRRKLMVVANGPSARGYFDKASDIPTLALNGAISLFTERGLEPTYWAACDSQESVAGFLPDNPPLDTIYLVASKCHPAVFDKLANRDVRLWHLKEQTAEGRLRIPPCCSVTMSAVWAMVWRGFTDFEFWGWDGCYIDGEHHAGATVGEFPPQTLEANIGGELKADDVVVGGRNYTTTLSWLAEYHAAEQFFHLADYFDLGITINGDGMIKAAQPVREG